MMLKVENLSASYGGGEAVRGVSLSVEPGQIVGVVGESGSGKSTLLSCIMGLLGDRGRILGGDILFEGRSLLSMGREERRQMRGKELAMVFQDPELSFDPLWTIGKTLYESIRVHGPVTKKEARKRGISLLSSLEFRDPEMLLDSYPSQLSGGMCQRAAIAAAIVCGPRLLLADEPTSALDVTVQKQVIDTMMGLRGRLGTAILIVSHNMGVIARMADMVGVMKDGELVEWGEKKQVLYSPSHEYTKALIAAVPRMDGRLPHGGFYG